MRIVTIWDNTVPYRRPGSVHWYRGYAAGRGVNITALAGCGRTITGDIETTQDLEQVNCEECRAEVAAQVLIDVAHREGLLGRK